MLFFLLISMTKMGKLSAGTLPVYNGKVVLISTYNRKNSHIILPKGKIKKGETAREAAERETLEESGACGLVDDTPFYTDKLISYFLMRVTELRNDFEEKKNRDVILMTYEEAMSNEWVNGNVKALISLAMDRLFL